MNNRLTALWKSASVDPEDYVGHDAGRNEEAARAGFVAKAKRCLNRVPLAHETAAMYFCMLDARTPVWVKATVGAALAYFVLPLDAVPDLLPVIGLSDDVSVLTAALTAVSTHVTSQHRDRAREWMAHEHLLNPEASPVRGGPLMAVDVRPTTPDDLPALSRFLADGFGAPAGSAFAAPEVLRWRYLEPDGGAPRSYLALEGGTGRLVGHSGVTRVRFRGAGLPGDGVPSLHMIDFLAAEPGKGVGTALIRHLNETAPTQHCLGATLAARAAMDRSGYRLRRTVPVYQRVLRPGYRLKSAAPGTGALGRLLRAAKDAAGVLARPAKRPGAAVDLEAVDAFGDWVEPVLGAYGPKAAFTTRGADRLNHLLRYPRGGLTGYRVVRNGSVRGLGMLGVVGQAGGVRAGRVVDCLLDDPDDADLWHAAVIALTDALRGRGADVAVGFASTDWSARALAASGYAPGFALEFRARDPEGRLAPADGRPLHLTPFEADYATT